MVLCTILYHTQYTYSPFWSSLNNLKCAFCKKAPSSVKINHSSVSWIEALIDAVHGAQNPNLFYCALASKDNQALLTKYVRPGSGIEPGSSGRVRGITQLAIWLTLNSMYHCCWVNSWRIIRCFIIEVLHMKSVTNVHTHTVFISIFVKLPNTSDNEYSVAKPIRSGFNPYRVTVWWWPPTVKMT